MGLATGAVVNGCGRDANTCSLLVWVKERQSLAAGMFYSISEAHAGGFPAGYQLFFSQCQERGVSSRYSGAMVADVHRVLLKGGVFMYPPTASAPNGKLRLMYECNRFAMVIAQAGGKAVSGSGEVMDVQPGELHQRVPVALGSPETVDDLLAALQESSG